MAKPKEPTKKPSRVKKVLGKRVDVPAAKGLSRDVKTPRPIRALVDYIKGSVYELRQVKWPTRRAALSLTFAVIVFTGLMVGFIILLDYGFEQLFKQVIL